MGAEVGAGGRAGRGVRLCEWELCVLGAWGGRGGTVREGDGREGRGRDWEAEGAGDGGPRVRHGSRRVSPCPLSLSPLTLPTRTLTERPPRIVQEHAPPRRPNHPRPHAALNLRRHRPLLPPPLKVPALDAPRALRLLAGALALDRALRARGLARGVPVVRLAPPALAREDRAPGARTARAGEEARGAA